MGNLSNANLNNGYLFLVIFPSVSISCKLVPVHYQQYEYSLLTEVLASSKKAKISKNKSG